MLRVLVRPAAVAAEVFSFSSRVMFLAGPGTAMSLEVTTELAVVAVV